MKKVYGYIRVSTAKQGQGVSLIEQKDAISRYAEKYGLTITEWFEEKETAAKRGRPLFTQMIRLLKARKADGVIIHKIDRSARNLKDWADITDLLDTEAKYEVHFAHESLDLRTRGGRLAADIQAAVASDFIRNNRQETIKGLYGRLKQGLYPFQAPVGYLNTGKGNLKIIDPIQGPLVRKAFELYASRKYSIRELVVKMNALGLRNLRGQNVTRAGISFILNNPFYIGILAVKGVNYNGHHAPLISSKLFKKVQLILSGRLNQQVKTHDFLFRKLLTCKECGYSLIGEIQKGHVYYRCHTKGCHTKSIRETAVENFLTKALFLVQLHKEETGPLHEELNRMEANWHHEQKEISKSIAMQKAQIEHKLERLTDCYIEGGLDREIFEDRKRKLLIELKEKQEMIRQLASQNHSVLRIMKLFLELAKTIVNTYQMGILEEKRELLEILTSNLAVSGKKLMISMRSPFEELAKRSDFAFGAP